MFFRFIFSSRSGMDAIHHHFLQKHLVVQQADLQQPSFVLLSALPDRYQQDVRAG